MGRAGLPGPATEILAWRGKGVEWGGPVPGHDPDRAAVLRRHAAAARKPNRRGGCSAFSKRPPDESISSTAASNETRRISCVTETKTYEGGCHCGRVRFRVETALTQAIECNCSICSKRGALWAPLEAAQFTLVSGEDALDRLPVRQEERPPPVLRGLRRRRVLARPGAQRRRDGHGQCPLSRRRRRFGARAPGRLTARIYNLCAASVARCDGPGLITDLSFDCLAMPAI